MIEFVYKLIQIFIFNISQYISNFNFIYLFIIESDCRNWLGNWILDFIINVFILLLLSVTYVLIKGCNGLNIPPEFMISDVTPLPVIFNASNLNCCDFLFLFSFSSYLNLAFFPFLVYLLFYWFMCFSSWINFIFVIHFLNLPVYHCSFLKIILS